MNVDAESISAADRASASRGAGDRSVTADGGRLDRVTLRFFDEQLEAAFRADFFGKVSGTIRAGYILGIVLWSLWGLVFRQFGIESRPFGIDLPDIDLVIRFGALVPILAVGLVLTMLPVARRIWEIQSFVVLLLNALIWTGYVSAISGVPFDLGYVGVILIMAFSYTLIRLRFVVVAATGLAMIVMYFAVTLTIGQAERTQLLVALFYLVSFYVLGMIAAYTLERFTRLLFLRERQLDHERARSEALLLNVLPRAIAERLMERAEEGAGGPDVERAVADEHPDVAVLFADLAGFTEQADGTPPDALVATLNDLFSEMDALADRYGLEKIKTVGDAYMAVAGVPTLVEDPAERAMGMALDLVAAMEARRWPSGDPVGVRVGIAAGPVVAGVIGRRKFAYDVWGDTVNLASRLQAAGRPGCILVAESMAERAGDGFVFGPIERIDLKGKGSQAVRTLLGRAGASMASETFATSPTGAPAISA